TREQHGMTKMRGFLRSKPKIDEAEWAIAQIRTAARLDEMFIPDEPPSDKDAAEVDDASSVVVGPGPWPGGPRPAIVVVGVSDIVSVLPKTRPNRPAAVTGDNGTVPLETQATLDQAVAAPTGSTVVAAVPDADAVALEVESTLADADVTTAEPTGDEPIGVMAGRGDIVGADTWRLPAVERPDPGVRVPRAAHVFPTYPTPREETPAEPAPAEPSPPGSRTTGRSATAGSPAKRASRAKGRSAPVPTAHCPYCAKILEPAPTTSRRCDGCRQRIIVKRVGTAAVYLTEAALPVFEGERRRVRNSVRWTRERDRWLRLASTAGAPAARQAQLAAARLSEDVVAAARTLYLTTVDRAFRAARRDRDWDEASRLRRDKAAVLYRVAGSPTPPPADIVAIFREGVVAELRGVAEISRDAELVGARCCDTCRADDRLIVRIAQELRAPRLPHAGCPKGLCRCHWDLAARDRLTMRRYLRRRPGAESRVVVEEPVPVA
ncbi:MAG TPA: hypothetical protein VF323_12440, partial [Candidatus Limnocylindrales bacterium]